MLYKLKFVFQWYYEPSETRHQMGLFELCHGKETLCDSYWELAQVLTNLGDQTHVLARWVHQLRFMFRRADVRGGDSLLWSMLKGRPDRHDAGVVTLGLLRLLLADLIIDLVKDDVPQDIIDHCSDLENMTRLGQMTEPTSTCKTMTFQFQTIRGWVI